jgi:hypothetical protein
LRDIFCVKRLACGRGLLLPDHLVDVQLWNRPDVLIAEQ